MKRTKKNPVNHESLFRLVFLSIASALFIVPFFWLKAGFVDLGGDTGRLYFLNPSAVVSSIFSRQTALSAPVYSEIPYIIYLSGLQALLHSPTTLINIEHGIQLALSFIAIYLVVKELLLISTPNLYRSRIEWASLVAGLFYVGVIGKDGWAISLFSQNQVFLNPLLFYLLLRLMLTSKIRYATGFLIISLIYSANFGYGSVPQIFAFYPIAVAFVILLILTIVKKPIPWKIIIATFISFIGLHAYQIVPILGNLIDSRSNINATVFSSGGSGAWYFDQIRSQYGKISTNIFQPISGSGTLLILSVPLTILASFLIKKSRLLSIIAIFFLLTLYLVSVNFSSTAVQIYRAFFLYIPGFIMFRSFYDKWYYVFAFFYSLLLGFSFALIIGQLKRLLSVLLGFLIVASVVLNAARFFRGAEFKDYLWQSNNIPKSFDMDQDVLSALSYAKKIPDDGNFLTLPLTFPYEQVIMGKTSGAYVGVSMVRFITGKKDYSGFWQFRPNDKVLLQALEHDDAHAVLQLFSIYNIKYIFRDTDNRIFRAFPRYPFYKYDMTTDIPLLDSQQGYNELLRDFPMQKIFEKGFFRVYAVDQNVVRPTIYVPDVIYNDLSLVLSGNSYRSAYLLPKYCTNTWTGVGCGMFDTASPTVLFKKNSQWNYTVSLDIKNRTEPFLLILSDDYHPSWSLSFNKATGINGLRHIMVNGYANGWIINPKTLGLSGTIEGTISQDFHKYYDIGLYVSITTLGIIIVFFIGRAGTRIYAKN